MKTIVYLISTVIMVITANNCEDKSSELGFKLTRHAYSSTVVPEYPACLKMCLDDAKCHSINFDLSSGNCEFNNASKAGVMHGDFVKASNTIFSDIVGRETRVTVPSCKALLDVTVPPGDGEHVIYPAGNPVTVYCDMTTDGGGWTLIKQLDMTTSLLTPTITGTFTDDYQDLSKYQNNLLFLSATGLKKLREDMGFDEIRFYCYKKTVGKVIHIKTNKDSLGEAVVKFYTVNTNFPKACGSFTILPDDTSELSRRCYEWGLSWANYEKWGHSSFVGEDRMYVYPALTFNPGVRFEFSFIRLLCDDNLNAYAAPAYEDQYKIFVR